MYTLVESSIVAIQLCNDVQFQVDQDYNVDGSIKPLTLDDRIELLVLDSSCNLIKLKELNGKLELVYSKRLANIEKLKAMVDTRRPYESICLTERTICMRNMIFSVEHAQIDERTLKGVKLHFNPFADSEMCADETMGGSD